jgi:hypothetical protein
VDSSKFGGLYGINSEETIHEMSFFAQISVIFKENTVKHG